MAEQILYIDDPKAGKGWKLVQRIDYKWVYDIPDRDPTDDDNNDFADQLFQTFVGDMP